MHLESDSLESVCLLSAPYPKLPLEGAIFTQYCGTFNKGGKHGILPTAEFKEQEPKYAESFLSTYESLERETKRRE